MIRNVLQAVPNPDELCDNPDAREAYFAHWAEVEKREALAIDRGELCPSCGNDYRIERGWLGVIPQYRCPKCQHEWFDHITSSTREVA